MRSATLRRAELLIGMVVLIAACASAPVAPALEELAESSELAVPVSEAIREVAVGVDTVVAASPEMERLEAYGTRQRLTNRIAVGLAERGLSTKAGERSLHVDIVGFRIRSDTAAYWGGVYSGPDFLSVAVESRRNGEVVEAFQTDASSILSGLAGGSGNHRLDRIIAEVARRVLAGLAPAEE